MPPTEFIASEGYDSWMNRGLPEPGDVVMTTEAPLGEIAQINNRKVALGQRLITLRGKPDVLNNTYLKFAMQAAFVQNQLKARSTGTTVLGISQRELRNVEIPLPPLPQQHRIAHILGTLDEKIELNRQMNETLEATARAIFKSWFVDFDPVKAKMEGHKPPCLDTEIAALFPSAFQDSLLGKIPKGWEVTRFADLTDVILGGDWGKSTEIGDWSCPVFCIRGADVPSLQIGGLGDMPIRYLKTSSLAKRQLQNGDLVIEISGGGPTQSTGRTILIKKELLDQLEFPLVYSNFCRVIRLRSENMSNFIYLWFRNLYSNDKFFQYENGTTGIKNFAFKVFAKEQYLCVPSVSIINAFNRTVEPLFKVLQFNGEHSRTLAQTRDALLAEVVIR